MAVRPSILCGSCGAPLALYDKYCAKCGASLAWDGEGTEESVSSAPRVVCQSCGVSNPGTNVVCIGCGSTLAAQTLSPRSKPTRDKKSAVAQQQSARKGIPGKRLESWKSLSIAGAVIVVALLGIGVLRNPPRAIDSQNQSLQARTPPNAPLLSDLEELQKEADANPKDPSRLLRWANALHDAKFMPRAIEVYKKYLMLKPGDPDARVDMAICYFESGDSPTALKEMHTALKYDPKHQMALFNIGIVNLNQGNLAESNEWFKKAIAADSKTEVAQRAQQILSQHSTIQQ